MPENVQAIVLAGGKGTRLAPLTEDTPKPLLKLAGKSVIEYVLDAIEKCGVTKVAVTTMYLPWQIEALGSRRGALSLSYVREQFPLGTAGAVKNAYDNVSDTVIVLSGDGLFDFDLAGALAFHREKGADATILTYKTEQPLDYGVVLFGADGKVSGFSEKPPWAKVVSGTVNTGIYILNRNILDKIPPATEFDFSRQLFPLLLAENKGLYAYEAAGKWFDIGGLDAYFSASSALLDGSLAALDRPRGLSAEQLAEKHVDLEEPVFVSSSAVIGQNVKLGAYTVIGDGAVISDGCDIACSVIGDGSVLGTGCGVYGTLLGRKCRIGENCVLSEGCAVGGSVKTDDGVILPKFSLIHASSHVTAGEFLSARFGGRSHSLFDDDGIAIDFTDTSPEYLVRLGLCAAKTASASSARVRVGILSDETPHARRAAETILCGIRAFGARSYDFGVGFPAMAAFAALRFVADTVLYVGFTENGLLRLRLFDRCGLPVTGEFEREFESNFYAGTDYTAPDTFYEPERFDSLWSLYYSELIKSCLALSGPDGLSGFRCRFPHRGDISYRSASFTALNAVCELGGEIEEQGVSVPEFTLDNSGFDATCVYRSIRADKAHIDAILIDHMTEEDGISLWFSGTHPDAYRKLAEKNHVSYSEYSSSGERSEMQQDAMFAQIWLNDAVFSVLRLCILLKCGCTTPEALIKALPAFEVTDRTVDGNPNRASVMQRLSGIASQAPKEQHDGIRLVLSGGQVTVIPGRVHGFRVISEARSAEAASELCEKAVEMLS